ncbi:MAG: ROK family protein [Actinomycetota bacterium]|nr:ROK family protein [Actinomycetota bacterium]
MASAIGVDIGGTKVLAVRLNAAGEVEAWSKRRTPVSATDVIDEVLFGVAQVAEGAGQAPESLPLGVGFPGMLDRNGTAHFCPHLHSVDGMDLRHLLAECRDPGAATVVLNDATAACWAEHSVGAARGFDDVLMVTLGTGIGGGMVAHGRLLEGGHGFAGEIGHMVIDPHGPPCPCGKRGCWERFASGDGLGRLAREAAMAGNLDCAVVAAGGDPEAVRGEHVTQAALNGYPEALAVMKEYAWWLALGLANLSNVLDPSVVVLGGGLIEAEHAVMEPLRDAFANLVEAPEARRLQVLPAQLGEKAGAVGAALLAAQQTN